MVPHGQVGGGHITNALFPRHAGTISKGTLVIIMALGIFWMGWVVWALLIYFLGAFKSIEVPIESELTQRSKGIAVVASVVFLLCIMLRPIYIDTVPLDFVDWIQE